MKWNEIQSNNRLIFLLLLPWLVCNLDSFLYHPLIFSSWSVCSELKSITEEKQQQRKKKPLLIALKIKCISTLPLTADVEKRAFVPLSSAFNPNHRTIIFCSIAMAYFHFSHPLHFFPIQHPYFAVLPLSLSRSLHSYLSFYLVLSLAPANWKTKAN